MIFFISYLYWSWGRGRARFSFEMWAVREHLHMITGSSRCTVHSLSLRFLLCERYWHILLLCLLLESDYLISTICYSVSVECAILGWVMFLFKQGEAFVPESIVRFGKRTEGRDGVVTITAEDERIKYILFCCTISAFCFLEYLQFKEKLYTLISVSKVILFCCCVTTWSGLNW